MKTSHTIRISTTDSKMLDTMRNAGDLITVDQRLSGMPRGTIWTPRQSASLQAQSALDDAHLRLGQMVLRAELHRLPEHEYTALCAASPDLAQYPGSNDLLTSLLGLLTPVQERAWHHQLVAAVSAGRQPGLPLQLVDDPWTEATWLREETRLIECDGQWFVSLSFELPPTPRPLAETSLPTHHHTPGAVI